MADGHVTLGGGAGIVVGGSYCTLTTVGRDHAGELVGFTAGHCGGPGAPVVAEGANNGPIGSVTTEGDGLDYAVIKLEPAKVAPTSSFAGFPVTGIGPDPEWHQHVCMNGAANGTICGGVASMPGPGPRGAMSHTLFQPGDDGAPITTDGRLLGVVFGGLNTPGDLRGLAPSSFTNFTKFSAILNDVNAKGGPGAGFTPIQGRPQIMYSKQGNIPLTKITVAVLLLAASLAVPAPAHADHQFSPKPQGRAFGTIGISHCHKAARHLRDFGTSIPAECANSRWNAIVNPPPPDDGPPPPPGEGDDAP